MGCVPCPTYQRPLSYLQVALTAFYNTATQGFATTFFNQTITIVEQPRLIDLELIFLWLLLLSLLGGGGMTCSDHCFTCVNHRHFNQSEAKKLCFYLQFNLQNLHRQMPALGCPFLISALDEMTLQFVNALQATWDMCMQATQDGYEKLGKTRATRRWSRATLSQMLIGWREPTMAPLNPPGMYPLMKFHSRK